MELTTLLLLLFLLPADQHLPGSITKYEKVTFLKKIKHCISTTGIIMPTNKYLNGHLVNFKSFTLLISKCTVDQISNVILLPENSF